MGILREVIQRWPAERIVGLAEFSIQMASLMALKPAIVGLHDGLAIQERLQALSDADVRVGSGPWMIFVEVRT